MSAFCGLLGSVGAVGGLEVVVVYCSAIAAPARFFLQIRRRFSADNGWLICVMVPKYYGFSAFVLGWGCE